MCFLGNGLGVGARQGPRCTGTEGTQLWCCVGLPMISQGHVGSCRSPTPLGRRHQGPMGEEQIATQLGPRLAAPSFISHRWGLYSLLS